MDRYAMESVEPEQAERSRHTMSLKKSMTKTRRRARWAGLLYLLGTIGFAAFAIFPLLGMPLINSPLLDFSFSGLKSAIAGFDFKSVAFWNAVLYCILVLATVINVFRALRRFGWLFKKKGSRVYGFNRPAYAMEIMGERCTGSLAAIVLTYLVMSILAGLDFSLLTMNDVFYLLLAIVVGTLIQILSGVYGCKISFFVPRAEAEIVEQKSEAKPFIALLCNLVQVAGSFAVMYFFLKESTVHVTIDKVITDGFATLTADIMTLVEFVLQVLTLFFIMGLVKHATGITEYNAVGLSAPNMKRARVLAAFTLILSAGAWAVYYAGKPAEEEIVYGFLIIAAISLAVFVLDVLLKHIWKAKLEKEERKAQEQLQQQNPYGNVGNNVVTGNAGHPPVAQPPIQLPPIYIQVPPSAANNVPFPVPMPVSTPVPVPMSAPCPLAGVQLPFNGGAPTAGTTEPTEETEGDVPPVRAPGEGKDWVVDCPRCKKALKINDSALYHRCPVCDQVFEIEMKEREVPAEQEEDTFSLVDFTADPFNS